MNNWINLEAVSKILIFGLLAGASVPTLFALGVRLHITNTGEIAEGRPNAARRRLLVGLSWVIFALVLVVVVVGVLFIAKGFIGHHTGVYLFGSKAHS
ncbi:MULTISPECIES: hypothetical protein [unclassified Mycolicibacterium]|uniref:hypothetical protein n=1 Tax=unclassified Mycolicibacterium TaxID=2636767 RepID=UPI0012DC069A|nr:MULTISPECIES: hypothetical protein [unclassified Mycolicibacterium]MUL81584.1 hypothetical protein [Mycolicibacterium sp. CBMA 329]MUL87350.1 hypothetical protein [Mycolicibacterium sp. CBMA 331]MUM02637.1 hypothetical protein [Mycolicibacterium sp. CBMA 334]MUM28479.1 hypothetical protein [Mycolicibacterium sp. CBMA 295]MUM37647.1 hypothetical protein [Mycolicibacterium sp. CBMA 247]